ncbi:unnamed protein product [Cunninghamella blakesleeana]
MKCENDIITNEVMSIEEHEKNSPKTLSPSSKTLSSSPITVYQCSSNRKYLILLIISLNGFLGPLSSSIYVPAIVQVRETFQTSATIINTTVSLYVFTQGIAPLGWAAISEYYGRRIVYITSSLLYIISTVVCALSPNVGLFIAFRIFQSVGSSAPQAVGAGTITDLFEMKQRGNAMGLFFLGSLLGPVIGPVVGGWLNEYVNWRYMFWLLTGLGGLVFLLIVFFLPETKVKQGENKKSGKSIILQPFRHLLQPAVLCASIPLALAYGFMYFMIASLPREMNDNYGLSSVAIGLAYLPNGIGNALGAMIAGIVSDRLIKKKPNPSKKDRLPIMWVGIFLLLIGELIYGWCDQYKIMIVTTMIGLFLLGLGVGFIQTPTNTYLVDAYSSSSASVISASNLLRCTCAGLTPLLAPTMISAIGNGWSMTILAGLTLISSACIILVQNMD